MAVMTWQQAEHERNTQLRSMAKAARTRGSLSDNQSERLMLTTVAVAWDTEAVIGEAILKKANLMTFQESGVEVKVPVPEPPPVDNAHVAAVCEQFTEPPVDEAPQKDG
jgi:hypothetical protein